MEYVIMYEKSFQSVKQFWRDDNTNTVTCIFIYINKILFKCSWTIFLSVTSIFLSVLAPFVSTCSSCHTKLLEETLIINGYIVTHYVEVLNKSLLLADVMTFFVMRDVSSKLCSRFSYMNWWINVYFMSMLEFMVSQRFMLLFIAVVVKRPIS